MFTCTLQRHINSMKNNKKKNYDELTLEVQHGSFMSMVMSEYGGIRKEDNKFYNCLNSEFFTIEHVYTHK